MPHGTNGVSAVPLLRGILFFALFPGSGLAWCFGFWAVACSLGRLVVVCCVVLVGLGWIPLPLFLRVAVLWHHFDLGIY